MSSADYDRLLGELADELTTHGSPQRRRSEMDGDLEALDDRLLEQQADLLHTATRLRYSPPRLSAVPPADPVTDPRRAVAAAYRHIDTADAAMSHALRWATVPGFLPKAGPRLRHLSMYALCAVVAAAVHALFIVRNGLTDAALGFAIAPAVAFAVAYLMIGTFGRPRLRRSKRPERIYRHPRDGLVMCVAIDLAAALTWMLA
ncbi:hypothetical protein LX16_3829 [Stackebrandtia albiflava]|uniref:Uncharacterized protein n=1 Tax=Stackebrandtia albiflava TaxID=406432 RepID=A0A562V585_9ACTN|nr:hypothetical protein [Stackebrandtia albiflava]TWJ13061.1 hypothetical protein LX16_3829 [Stackebrandtia albiflava]